VSGLSFSCSAHAARATAPAKQSKLVLMRIDNLGKKARNRNQRELSKNEASSH
jgi:hypothetical protein